MFDPKVLSDEECCSIRRASEQLWARCRSLPNLRRALVCCNLQIANLEAHSAALEVSIPARERTAFEDGIVYAEEYIRSEADAQAEAERRYPDPPAGVV